MDARMRNQAAVLLDAVLAVQVLKSATKKSGLPRSTLELVNLRASQIYGCEFCVDEAAKSARKTGLTDGTLLAVAKWQREPQFTDAERAALALTEAATRLVDRSQPVPTELWDEVTQYYDEEEIAVLILMIVLTNRLKVVTKQVVGSMS